MHYFVLFGWFTLEKHNTFMLYTTLDYRSIGGLLSHPRKFRPALIDWLTRVLSLQNFVRDLLLFDFLFWKFRNCVESVTFDCAKKSFQEAQIVQKELKSHHLDAGVVDIDKNDGYLNINCFNEQSFFENGDLENWTVRLKLFIQHITGWLMDCTVWFLPVQYGPAGARS